MGASRPILLLLVSDRPKTGTEASLEEFEDLFILDQQVKKTVQNDQRVSYL